MPKHFDRPNALTLTYSEALLLCDALKSHADALYDGFAEAESKHAHARQEDATAALRQRLEEIRWR